MYLMHIYFVFMAFLWGLGLNLIIVHLIWLLYYIFVFVNSKLYNIYQNINVFLLCIRSYHTYNDVEY